MSCASGVGLPRRGIAYRTSGLLHRAIIYCLTVLHLLLQGARMAGSFARACISFRSRQRGATSRRAQLAAYDNARHFSFLLKYMIDTHTF